jgi:hypothetical protein
MAVKPTTTTQKPALYKMVSLPSFGVATATRKTSENTKVVATSYKSFITSINRMGATLNSTIIVNQQILKTINEDLKLRGEEFERMKGALQKEKAEKDIDGTDEGGKKEPWWMKAVGGIAKAVVPSFFSALASLGEFFLRAFVVQGVLKWISNPENGKKLANIVNGLVKLFKWLFTFITENLAKTIEGLVDMFDSDKSIWERIVAFGTFITGFGSLLLGMAFLKSPGLLIKGVKFVLTTLYKNLFKSKATLAKRAASGGFGAWSSAAGGAAGARGGGGGRGKLLSFAAGVGTAAVAGSLMSGGDETSPEPKESSAPSPNISITAPAPPATPSSSQEPSEPMLAEGGIATKPTSAILGERGPEIKLPLSGNIPIPSDNEKRRKDAGIKPLSSLGSLFGGGSQQKQQGADQSKSADLSKLFMAPFKGIGAGILANVSQVVSSIGGPTGKLITPILGNIIAPIANAFGVPPTVVKTIQGKISGSVPSTSKIGSDKKNESLKKLFGKAGSVPSDQEKKFKKKNDTSVFGLLSDILGASIVINNKLKKSGGAGEGGGGGSSGSESGDTSGDSETSTGASGGGAAGTPTNTAQDTIKKAGGMGEDGSLQGVQGETKVLGNKRGGGSDKEHSPGAGLMPVDGGDRKYWYNNSGDVFGWQKPGDPLTDITSSQDKQMLQSLGGPLVRDLKDGKVKILKGMMGGDQTPVGYFSYDMGAILKKRGESGQGRSKTGATKDQWEKPADGKYGPTITPKKANGGWISGPMSGYPVSLDGGQSVAFEGHGTEWVGLKKSAGGRTNDAFVVPFNTPATKNNGGLVDRRLSEAKRGGYSLPEFAKGGRVKPKSSTTSEATTDKGTDKKQGSGGLSAAVAAGKYLLQRGFTVAEHPNFTKNSWNKEGPNTGTGYNSAGSAGVGGHSSGSLHYKGLALDITDWRSGDWQGRTKTLAEEMYKNRDQLKLTQIIHDPWGSWFAGGGKGGAIGGHDTHLHLGFASGPGDAIGDLKGSSESSSDAGGDGGDTEKTPEEQLREQITSISQNILKLSGVTPANDINKATEQVKDEKDKAQQAANTRINNAATQAMVNARGSKPGNVKKAFAMEPIILPGPKQNLPIEALNPSTSMIQYGWKVNL